MLSLTSRFFIRILFLGFVKKNYLAAKNFVRRKVLSAENFVRRNILSDKVAWNILSTIFVLQYF